MEVNVFQFQSTFEMHGAKWNATGLSPHVPCFLIRHMDMLLRQLQGSTLILLAVEPAPVVRH